MSIFHVGIFAHAHLGSFPKGSSVEDKVRTAILPLARKREEVLSLRRDLLPQRGYAVTTAPSRPTTTRMRLVGAPSIVVPMMYGKR